MDSAVNRAVPPVPRQGADSGGRKNGQTRQVLFYYRSMKTKVTQKLNLKHQVGNAFALVNLRLSFSETHWVRFNLEPIKNNILLAKNEEVCDESIDIEIQDKDNIAVIPPLSGGCKTTEEVHPPMFLFQNLGLQLKTVPVQCGLVCRLIAVCFISIESKVIKLEYEAYEQMALKAMKNICNEIREKWPPVHGIVLHHRLGVVPVREASVVIAISSPHRTDSLEAVAFCIDRLKSTVPIWKKEIYESDPPAWKENPECAWSSKTEPEYPELTLEKNLVQINVSREQLQQRINNFIERKREQVNVNNIHDFIPSKNMQQVDESETCARVRTSFVRRKDSKGHLKVRKVINEWGPQTSHPMVKSESRASTGLPLAIAERVMNIEKFLNIAPVEPDIYQRLKNMEDRIAYLQSISPEYSQFWNRHDLEDNIKRENDMDFLYTADDLSRKIEQLERNGDDL
ncbi:Molybdopterin synthase catalytic subunit [Eumeta japonica]|uniref:Molybdopterin synthase catalytic subunit n=1 Tax=Eumeta variegata TaxID=151549 RepID=A0A4C1UDH4_EUMVA|nr:Molybdopterin synthase catalytic subunit [Eumeta japonica]